MTETCPCQSSKPYKNCCQPYIEGTEYPATPEALMRSRYTAYALKKLDYIQDTMFGPAAKGFDLAHAIEVAKTTEWRGLEVAAGTAPVPQANKGYVTFIAHYRFEHEDFRIFEKSEFRKKGQRWYYYSGKQLNAGLIPKLFKD